MGVGVVGSLWPERLEAAGAILLHAPAVVPDGVRPGTPVQAHVAAGDPFAPASQLAAFRDSAALAGADAALYTYPRAGHFFTDADLPDHDRSAAVTVQVQSGPWSCGRGRIEGVRTESCAHGCGNERCGSTVG